MTDLLCKESRKHWHIGFAYGMLEGISKRFDVPQDIRNLCKKAVEKYKKELEDGKA